MNINPFCTVLERSRKKWRYSYATANNDTFLLLDYSLGGQSIGALDLKLKVLSKPTQSRCTYIV